MNEVAIKLDNLLLKAGQINYYQFQITCLLLIEIICADFFSQCLHFLERRPFVLIDDSKKSIRLNHSICINETINYIIDESKLSNSIVMDFEIYCQEEKIFFIGFMGYFGMILGACSSYLFADKFGRKKALLIMIPIHIILLITLKFLTSQLGDFGLYLKIFIR